MSNIFSWGPKKDKEKIKEKFFNDTKETEAERQNREAKEEREEYLKNNPPKKKDGGIIKNPCGDFDKIKKLMKKK